LLFTDQTGRSLELGSPPKRIVSCVPSQSELLSDLGLENEVVGITKFCVHPARWRKQKTIIGGTKNLDLEKIARLSPDFILSNKEENLQSQIEWLAARFTTYVSDVRNLPQAMDMMRAVGEITSTVETSKRMVAEIESFFQSNKREEREISACYLIWRNPWMTINNDTFIHDMLARVGFKNVFGDRKESRYPIISDTELMEANPEILFLSSEPFPFGAKHVKEIQQLLPKTKIYLIDGKALSWYGSGLCRFDGAFFENLRKQQCYDEKTYLNLKKQENP